MNKKIFITLFAFIGFMFFFNCSNVFASYDFKDSDNNVFTLPDLPADTFDNYAFVSRGFLDTFNDGKAYPFTFVYSKSPISLGTYHNNITSVYSDSEVTIYTYKYYLDDNVRTNEWYFQGTYTNGCSLYLGSLDNKYCVITNHALKIDGTDDVLFGVAPSEENPEEPAPTPTSTLQVAPTLTSTDLSGILAQILAILPVVLMVLISLLALRKAIHLLLRILGQA